MEEEQNSFSGLVVSRNVAVQHFCSVLDLPRELIRLVVDFYTDPLLYTASDDGTIKMWDVSSKQSLFTFLGHSGFVNALVECADGRLVSGSRDSYIRIWKLTDGKYSLEEILRSNNIQGAGTYPFLHTKQKRNENENENDTKTESREVICVSTFKAHPDYVTALLLLNDNTLVSASYDPLICIWDINESRPTEICKLAGHQHNVICLAALPGNARIASGSRDKTIKIWEAQTRSCVATLIGHESCVYALLALADGRLVSGCEGCRVIVWDTEHYVKLQQFVDHTDYVYSLALLPDGIVASGGADRKVILWDMSSYTKIQTIRVEKSFIYSLAPLSAGRLAMGTDRGELVVCNVNDAKQTLHVIPAHRGYVNALLSSSFICIR